MEGLQDWFKDIKDTAAKLTGYGYKKEPNPPTMDAKRADAHAALGEVSDEIEDDQEDALKGKGKRGRTMEQEARDSASNKRRRGAGQNGMRLEGDYRVPKDAVRIHVPTTNWDDDIVEPIEESHKPPPRGTARVGHKVTNGGLKPINTLAKQQSGVARAAGRPAGERCVLSETNRSAQGKLREQNNGPRSSRRDETGGGFAASDRLPKRQKTSTTAARSTRQDPISLDDSDDMQLTADQNVLAVNERRPSHNSQQSHVTIDDSQTAGKLDDRFKPNEQNRLNQHVNPKISKRRRTGYPGSNRESAQPPSSRDPRTSPEVRRDGSSAQPVDLEVDSPASQPSAKKPRVEPSDRSKLPRIDLDKGVDAYIEDTLRQTDAKHTREASQAMPKPSYRNKRIQPTTQEPSPAGARPASRSNMASPSGLRHTFQREQPAPVAQQQPPLSRIKRKDAMQENTPKQRRAQECQDSADELAISPDLKRRPASSSRDAPPATNGDLGSASHSRFRLPSSVDSRPNLADAASVDDVSAENAHPSILLTAIYSRGCVLDQGTITLDWDAEDKSYLVCHEGQTQWTNIGRSEVHQWLQCKDLPFAYIRGSATPYSYGHILLQFLTLEGRDECFDTLDYAFNVKMQTEDREKLAKVFKTQEPIIKSDHERYAKLAEKSKIQAPSAKRYAQSVTQPSDEEITYDFEVENGMPSRRTSGRNRIQDNSRAGPEASPYFTEQGQQVTRRSTRPPKPVKAKTPTPPPPERWTEIHNLPRWSQPVLYPPQGARRITIDFDDLERLDETEFLNDNIVGFALRRTEENMSPEHRDKVHFFNSFFYSSLSTKNGKKGFNYEAVQKWTKGKDIFSIPYVVVPINENLHWYLAIICNLPNLARRTEHAEDESLQDLPLTESPGAAAEASDNRSHVVPDSQEDSKPPPAALAALTDLTLDDANSVSSKEKDETFITDDEGKVTVHHADREPEVHQSTKPPAANGKKKGKKAPPPLKKIDTRQTVIITLDSFGSAHVGEVAKLKDYINLEAQDKRGMEVPRDQITGLTAKGIPQQTNFCDCGLYLVGYVQEFAKDPEKFVKKVLSRELDLNCDFEDFDPSNKRNEIRDDLLRLYEEQEGKRKAEKKRKKDEKEAAARLANPTKATPKPVATDVTAVPIFPFPKPAAEAPSSERRVPPKALWAPAEDTTSAVDEPSRPADEDSRPPSVPRANEQPQEAEEDNLETGPPRALTDNMPVRKVYPAKPSLSKPRSQPSASPEAEEMLDKPSPHEHDQYGAVSPRHKTDASLFSQPFDLQGLKSAPTVNHRSHASKTTNEVQP